MPIAPQVRRAGRPGRGIDLAPIDPCNPNTASSPSPANHGIVGPTLNSASPTVADASTCAKCTVEVFLADAPAAVPASLTPAGQGKQFVGSAVADGSGHALVPSKASTRAIRSPPQPLIRRATRRSSARISPRSGSLPTPTPTPTASPQTVYGLDHFSRQVTNGWGTADVGGTWAVESSTRVAGQAAVDYNVDGTSGSMIDRSANLFNSAYLTDVSAQDVDISFAIKTDQLLRRIRFPSRTSPHAERMAARALSTSAASTSMSTIRWRYRPPRQAKSAARRATASR